MGFESRAHLRVVPTQRLLTLPSERAPGGLTTGRPAKRPLGLPGRGPLGSGSPVFSVRARLPVATYHGLACDVPRVVATGLGAAMEWRSGRLQVIFPASP